MRLPPLTPDELGPELRAVHDKIAELMAHGQPQIVSQDDRGAMIGPFPATLHFPRFGVPALNFLAAIGVEAKLPPSVRETAILTTGACLNARYEIYAHEIMAQVAGLSVEQVASLAVGQRPPDLAPEEGVAFEVAKTLAAGNTLPASTYEQALALLGRDGVGELAFLIGGYSLIAALLNCFDVPSPS